MNKPRLLDLFCGAGGASMGYSQAGFDVVGVDIAPQPRYPFSFIQADALTFDLVGFDAIHASPPCQSYSTSRYFPNANKIPAAKLIEPIRARLAAAGVPWIIENVVGAEMPDALELCGSMFGLSVRRHRWFSSSLLLFAPRPCRHTAGFYNPVGGKIRGYGAYASNTMYTCANGEVRRREGYYRVEVGRRAMGIDWMTMSELSQAIPPAYTAWLGAQLLEYMRREVCA